MTLPNLIGPWVDVRSFAPPGTPRDGNIPWHDYIQAAADYIVAQILTGTPVGTLYFPPGRYRIDQPIRIARVDNGRYSFCSINIVGDAPPYGGDQFHGSAIVPSYTDKPAIIIQCGRAVRIENLAIMGKNTWASKQKVTIDTLYDDENFLVDGVTDDSRHAPYAGICIDPFCSPKLADSYPGLDAFYLPSGTSGTSGSSSITIERCFIDGFVVGIAISPNQFAKPINDVYSTQNAENIAIDTCTISSTKSSIAICQDQSRSVTCRNLAAGYTKYVIDCTHYGKGTGNCPSIFGACINYVKYLFSAFSFGAAAVIEGLYCEVVLSIGVLAGNGGSFAGYAFSGCTFNLMCSTARPAIGHHLVNLATATFDACSLGVVTWEDTKEAVPLWIYNGGGPMSLRNCFLGVSNYPDNSLPFWINGSLPTVSFDNVGVIQTPLNTILSRIVTYYSMYNIANETMLPGCFVHALGENACSPHWIAGGQRFIALGDAETTGLAIASDGTANFTPPTAGIVAPGDIVFLRKPYNSVIDRYPHVPVYPTLGKVIVVDANTGVATVKWVPDYVVNDAVVNKNPPGSGDLMYVVGFYKMHYATSGTVTNGSNVITDVSIGNPLMWIAGDRIRDDGHLLPPDTYVMAYDAALRTITLSRVVTASTPATGTPVKLYDAEIRVFDSTQVYSPTETPQPPCKDGACPPEERRVALPMPSPVSSLPSSIVR